MRAGDIVRGLKKIDVLLVNLELFYELNFSNINVGLKYIATMLEREGFKVQLLGTRDLYKKSKAELGWIVRRQKPAITGFYVISDNYELVKYTAEKIRRGNPDTWIIAGGPLAAALGEELLRDEVFDGVITGEGEYALRDICNAKLRNKGNLGDVAGLIWRENGEIKHGAPVCPIENLDELPFPDKKYNIEQQAFQVVSGRGCPYKCSFCFQAGHGLRYRFRSSRNVLDEIVEGLESMPVIGFDFVDDAFVVDPKRCREIAQGLIEYKERTGRDFIFFCQGRVNVLDKNPDLVGLLARAGMARMQLGIESGDPHVLELYRKQITVDQVRRTVEEFRKAGNCIAVGGFILGGPFESEESFSKTLDLALELIRIAPGAFEASAGFLGAYPGTEIAENPDKFGLTMIEPDFIKGHSLSDVQFITPYMDRNRIRDLHRRFNHSIRDEMVKVLPRMPSSLIKFHVDLAQKYQMFTQLYSLVFQNRSAITRYFKYLESQRFSKLEDIKESEAGEWYPMRTLETRTYTSNGGIYLPLTLYDCILEDPAERLAYELSCSKLKIKDVCRRIKAELMTGKEESEIMETFLMPFYRKLEKTFHVVFHQYTDCLPE